MEGKIIALVNYINNGECLIINSKIAPAKKILSKEKIHNILPDITRDKKIYERSWDTDDPNPLIRFSCAHLSHFTTEIGQLEAEEYTIELIKEKINKLFENAAN